MTFPERVSVSELCKLTGVSRQTLWRRSKMRANGFPRLHKDGGRVFFNADEVAAYLANGCSYTTNDITATHEVMASIEAEQ